MADSNGRVERYATQDVILSVQNGWSTVIVCVWRRVKLGAPVLSSERVVR